MEGTEGGRDGGLENEGKKYEGGRKEVEETKEKIRNHLSKQVWISTGVLTQTILTFHSRFPSQCLKYPLHYLVPD